MKKNDFMSLVIGVIGGLLFAIGMCMCLLPEWNAFTLGVVVTAAGALVLLVLLFVRWKQAGKPMVKVNWKSAGVILFGIVSVLVFGLGMCMIMVWEGLMLPGIVVGVAGMLLLLCLIPMVKGLE